ncbi:hypothetical protein J6G99_04730, partial [bacterium]|nr:hypothetical protein [bacterium]
FQLNPENYVDTAGIVLGDGTPMILSWNKNCPVSDPDTVEKGQTTACISGIYDLNGSKGPNKFGKDVIAFGSANLGWISFAGLKVSRVFNPSPLKLSDYCESDGATVNKYGQSLGIKNCMYSESAGDMGEKDYWAGAVKHCMGMNASLPSTDELIAIAKSLYDVKSGDSFNSVSQSRLNQNASNLTLLSNSSRFQLWSSKEVSSVSASLRDFDIDSTDIYYGKNARNDHYVEAICVFSQK